MRDSATCKISIIRHEGLTNLYDSGFRNRRNTLHIPIQSNHSYQAFLSHIESSYRTLCNVSQSEVALNPEHAHIGPWARLLGHIILSGLKSLLKFPLVTQCGDVL